MNILNGLLEQFGSLIERLRASVASIEGRGGFGTGIVWSYDGLILTNDHVAQESHPQVVLGDGRRVSSQVVARDERNDLALLKVNASGLVPIERGDARSLRVGELLIAVGHPLGLRDSAALGVVNRTDSFVEGRELLCADLKLAPETAAGR